MGGGSLLQQPRIRNNAVLNDTLWSPCPRAFAQATPTARAALHSMSLANSCPSRLSEHILPVFLLASCLSPTAPPSGCTELLPRKHGESAGAGEMNGWLSTLALAEGMG